MQLQKITFKKLLQDNDVFLMSRLDSSYFTKVGARLYNILNKYYNAYNKLPTIDEFIGVVETKVKKDKDILIEYINSFKDLKVSMTSDEIIKELQQAKLIRELDDLAPKFLDLLENKDIEGVSNLLNNIQSRLNIIDDKLTKDIKEIEFKPLALATADIYIDSMRNAGLKLAGLSIVGAKSGQGKSIFSLNQALYHYKQGNKVSILSLELPESQVLLRLYSMVNKVPYSDLIRMDKNELKGIIQNWVKDYFKDNSFFIRHFRYNVDEIKKVILNDIKRGVNFFVVDYLNLVEMSKSQEDWRSLSNLVKDLHDIAMTYGVVILSPTQVNIEENKNKKINVTTRGARELEFSSSVFLLIHQNSEEYKENVARILVMKSRNSQRFTSIVKTNFKCMLFEDTGVILDDI